MLVVLMGSLGDVARGVYIAEALKTQRPDVSITWLVEPSCEPLVRLHPKVDRVLVFRRGGGLPALVEIIRALRRIHFDAAIDLQRHLKSGFFSFLSGAPLRLGFHRDDAKEFNWLFNNRHIEACPDEINKLEHYGRFLEALGLELQLTASGMESLDLIPHLDPQLRQEKQFVGVVLGSSWRSKDWLVEHYIDLVRGLAGRSEIKVVLLGDKSQSALGARIARESDKGNVVNLAGSTSLLGLLAAIKFSRVCVGPDSGPGHIASALGVPYVSLFGPTSPQRTAPWNSRQLVLRSGLACSPCNRRACPGLGRLCMRLIEPKSVLQAVQAEL